MININKYIASQYPHLSEDNRDKLIDLLVPYTNNYKLSMINNIFTYEIRKNEMQAFKRAEKLLIPQSIQFLINNDNWQDYLLIINNKQYILINK